MGQKINGNHVVPKLIMPDDVAPPPPPPAELEMLRESFSEWTQTLAMRLHVGARFKEAFEKPRVDLARVWPQFVAWMMSDEVYGMLQFFNGNKKLTEIGMEIIRLLEMRGRGEEVPKLRMLEMAEALMPYGEKLTDNDHLAAGAAWQSMFAAAMDDAPLAVRYAIAANQQGQPGNKQTALLAAINVYRRKLLELLKV